MLFNKQKEKRIDDLRYQNEYEALSKAGFKIIQLILDPQIQEERIKKVYSNNYKDHLSNLNHISEKNEFQWFEDEDPLIIDSGKETILDIMDKIKNKYFSL